MSRRSGRTRRRTAADLNTTSRLPTWKSLIQDFDGITIDGEKPTIETLFLRGPEDILIEIVPILNDLVEELRVGDGETKRSSTPRDTRSRRPRRGSQREKTQARPLSFHRRSPSGPAVNVRTTQTKDVESENNEIAEGFQFKESSRVSRKTTFRILPSHSPSMRDLLHHSGILGHVSISSSSIGTSINSPYPGTVLDQPSSMIDGFRIFQSELNSVFGSDRPVTTTELYELMASVYGVRK